MPAPPPRRAIPTTPTPPPTQMETPDEESRPERRSAGAKDARPKVARRRPVSEQAMTVRPVTFSLPAPLVVALKQRARKDGVAQPDVLMDAFVAAEGRLPDLLAGLRKADMVSDGLFLRKQPSAHDDPPVVLSMRLLSTNLAAIDALQVKHSAPSRSALCAVVLKAYLQD